VFFADVRPARVVQSDACVPRIRRCKFRRAPTGGKMNRRSIPYVGLISLAVFASAPYPGADSSLLHVSIEFLCLSITVVQFLFTILTHLFHKKWNRLKTRVLIYAHQTASVAQAEKK
jgi:hypothetical protein